MYISQHILSIAVLPISCWAKLASRCSMRYFVVDRYTMSMTFCSQSATSLQLLLFCTVWQRVCMNFLLLIYFFTKGVMTLVSWYYWYQRTRSDGCFCEFSTFWLNFFVCIHVCGMCVGCWWTWTPFNNIKTCKLLVRLVKEARFGQECVPWVWYTGGGTIMIVNDKSLMDSLDLEDPHYWGKQP